MKTLNHWVPILIAITFAGCARSSNTSKADAAAARPYPLPTCVVSGEKLGSMGEPVVFVHEGQQVKLCCKSCRPDFDKEPAKYMAKIQSAK